ncbi:MAG TPA: S8 family serine peptidase [Bryobacteraceae bacterium]|nr:S8 family serine peptidase [Bryobacteraceae bacterium]
MANANRILVKLRPEVALRAASPQTNLRPLYDTGSPAAGFGAAAAPAWYMAEIADGGDAAWDAAHARVSDQLGVSESDVLFAEPDLPQSYPDANERNPGKQPFALDGNCAGNPQKSDFGRTMGPAEFAWHLGDSYSQLGSARDSVQFTDPRTRIAHIDTGYDKNHHARPERMLEDLERNFVNGNDQPNSAQDPDRHHMFDNSGHGTGTSGILAGRQISEAGGKYLGGAPQADILPIRIADSVVLFFTSAFAKALQYAVQQNCDVISISMGGLPSGAWNDAVNAAYEAGICVVAASGDCFAGLPTHNVVYPARYLRAIAACGVMADGKPYYNLPRNVIEGSWGPDSSMTTALSTYTPNIPWARFGCPTTIDLDGQGTSASTPQIAAAVALWYEKNKTMLPRDWRRVEAARNALFTSARQVDPDLRKYIGRGILQAKAALGVAPVLNLPKTPADDDSFSFFRVITGLGLDQPPVREAMFNLELMQRCLMNPSLQEAIPDPEAGASPDAVRKFMEAVIQDKGTSLALRKHIANRYTLVSGAQVQGAPEEVVPPPHAACEKDIKQPSPPYRRLRAYAVDPSFATRLDTAAINEATLKIPWERLKPGPVGEYLEVTDTDAAGIEYEPVNLEDPMLLAQDGCSPAEGNPAFHQQMVYAVAMTTIQHFETALGRPVLWRPEPNPQDANDDSRFHQRLQIRPHALHEANAYYSPPEIALLLGYFQASENDPGDHAPGSAVYACLSHDIVAHETTHAILDGMHRRFNEPTNLDVLALHEAFADIVALLQHFTIPEVLENQIGRTRGDLEAESMLGSLALQFGRAMGGRGALRDAIGSLDENNVWTPRKPNPADYQNTTEPHARGALLVAAVFNAFLAIYKTRTADLLRIYTRGTGILPAGAIHPDLVHRLAEEASKSAHHVLRMCIRAIDYLPPVDVTFGEFLRGLITADADMVQDDRYRYRIAFIEAFRKYGLYPRDLNTLSEDTLRWGGVDFDTPPPQYKTMLRQLKRYADACFYVADRKQLFERTFDHRRALHTVVESVLTKDRDFAAKLQINPDLKFEVAELRRSLRVNPNGGSTPQVIVGFVQSRPIQIEGSSEPHTFLGGSTVVVDLSKPAIDYVIYKRIDSENRLDRTKAFLRDQLSDPVRALLISPKQKEPFAALHALAGMDIS